MALQVIRLEQGPDDNLPYRLDFSHFSDELLTADPLASAAVNNTPEVTSPALSISAPSVSTVYVSFRVSGGADGTTYRIEIKATTTAGRDITAFIDMTIARPASTA